MNCPNSRIRNSLRAKTDDLQAALFMLNSCPTVENMIAVNAYWTRAFHALQKAYPAPDPSGPQAARVAA